MSDIKSDIKLAEKIIDLIVGSGNHSAINILVVSAVYESNGTPLLRFSSVYGADLKTRLAFWVEHFEMMGVIT